MFDDSKCVLYYMWQFLDSGINYIDDNLDNYSDDEKKRLMYCREHISRASLALFPVAYKDVEKDIKNVTNY